MTGDTSRLLRTYWITWGGLLALTLVMLVLDQTSWPRPALVLLVLAAMTIKAVLIAGTFMHLRFERMALVVTVVVGLFLNGLILYGLIAPDAARIAASQPW